MLCVFAQTDGSWVHHHLTLFHQRCRTHCVTGAYSTNIQEGGSVRQETAVRGDTVDDSGHTEFAHAVVNVVPRCVFVDGFRTGPQGQVGRCRVCRPRIPGGSGPKASMAFWDALRLAILDGLCSLAMNSLAFASKSTGMSPAFIRRVNSAASAGRAFSHKPAISHSMQTQPLARLLSHPTGRRFEQRDFERRVFQPLFAVSAISASPSGAPCVVPFCSANRSR